MLAVGDRNYVRNLFLLSDSLKNVIMTDLESKIAFDPRALEKARNKTLSKIEGDKGYSPGLWFLWDKF